MKARQCELKDGRVLEIREAAIEDAAAVLDFVADISGESEFLTFGLGEFEGTVPDEENFVGQCRAADNQLFILGTLDGEIIGNLIFHAGRRPRMRHAGELSMSVRKAYWGLGIGSALIDALIDWARQTGVVTKINLRVRTDHDRAIRLYERKGFAIEGTMRREIAISGRYYDLHWMGMML